MKYSRQKTLEFLRSFNGKKIHVEELHGFLEKEFDILLTSGRSKKITRLILDKDIKRTGGGDSTRGYLLINKNGKR